jgi:uncharacterized protein (DUF1330 family)
MKKAYVVAEARVTDPAADEEYLALSASTVEQYGGRFIVRGGQRDQRERGNAKMRRTATCGASSSSNPRRSIKPPAGTIR